MNTFLNAQTENDSLAKYSYEELHALIDSTKYDKQELSKLYTEEYLKRAKLDGNEIKISRGYFYLTYYYYDKNILLGLKYADSIIDTCKDCRHNKYPALGYYFKGYFYSLDGLTNTLALNNFLKALKVLSKNRNVELELDTRNAIISIQGNWSANEETLDFIKEDLEFLITNKENIQDFKIKYLYALGNLCKGYIKNKKYNESLKISKQGIQESLIFKDTLESYDFTSLAGQTQYYLGNYQAAIDSSLKVLPHLIKIDDRDLVMEYYYLAKSYNKLKQPEKAQFHFLKTDSIYQATKDIFPEMRNVYEHIIEYYKSKNDVENQIKYYDRLIETDKIIDSTYTYVTETVNKKFDTPQAIAERARLLEEAQAKENSWKYRFGAISGILLIILGILIAAFRRQKYYKKRFENLMNVEQPQNTPKKSAEALEARKTQTKEIDVPQEIVENILTQLQKFEASQKFTKQISLADLAKKLKTNPKYLSKVINGHYEKNFSSYMNELRIEYVISKLKTDSKFRNYTIKAIGKEAGFGNTESFSKAFHKITGIKPSYFINQLQKRLESKD
ncbi:AraC family transcriptional regulator [Kordia sp. SMS9]|uniref:helix-turn-helix domain-containing protein n=1 Tax=Kordia sp. SMS9 TaxID=2282170 RepID=UPI0019657906|nr:AraC family transcriptional regulator [Kordia sp. SMS9]